MFRSFLSWRYLTHRRTNLIGILGIFVGVFALILIISIMTGFLDKSRETVRGSLSDIIIAPVLGTGWGDGWEDTDGPPTSAEPILAAVRAQEGVAAAAPHLNWFGLITIPGEEGEVASRLAASSTHGPTLGVQLVGVDVRTDEKIARATIQASLARWGVRFAAAPIQDEFDTTEFYAGLTRAPRMGRLVEDPLHPFRAPVTRRSRRGPELAGIVIGEQLYRQLQLRPGQEIQISTAVQDPVSDEWTFNNRSFRVSGTFRSGENDMDLGRVYLERPELADFLGGRQEFSEVLVRVEDYAEDGEAIRDRLRVELDEAGLILGGGYRDTEVRTWEEFRGNLLGAIKNERVLMMLMLTLVLLVAAFTVFAILSMMVTEKRRDIGILSALGATPRGILELFLMIAFWDALIGSLAGMVLGTWAAFEVDAIEQWLSSTLGVQIFDRNVYLFDHIPSHPQPVWIATFVVMAFLLSLLFAALPAFRAASLDPLEALRYE